MSIYPISTFAFIVQIALFGYFIPEIFRSESCQDPTKFQAPKITKK